MPPSPSQQAGSLRKRGLAFGLSAVLSLLLSPITAIFAALIGALGFGAAVIAGRGITLPAAVFGGIAAGALPYIVAGLII
ncbi:hypothetical protein [Actinomadura sp. NBRC 104412]|uniref:hypothetical protein n=1 Tax=Actinomadura sp. NBRC 104412 TaxID=3032203 RepID=UPI0025534813|nr:hypothetical protein [Actinomadura sp. NBRC 104412]